MVFTILVQREHPPTQHTKVGLNAEKITTVQNNLCLQRPKVTDGNISLVVMTAGGQTVLQIENTWLGSR